MSAEDICKNTNDTTLMMMKSEIEANCEIAKAQDTLLKKEKSACNKGILSIARLSCNVYTIIKYYTEITVYYSY